jgi:hypothetical protein
MRIWERKVIFQTHGGAGLMQMDEWQGVSSMADFTGFKKATVNRLQTDLISTGNRPQTVKNHTGMGAISMIFGFQ